MWGLKGKSLKRQSCCFTVRWDSSVGGLTFADQFLQIAARIHCRTMQGFGEHVHPHLSHDFTYKTWPMFARDQPPGVGTKSSLIQTLPNSKEISNELHRTSYMD